MPRQPRVLLVTPDFPPEKGGIQILLERLVRNAGGLDFRVLTLGQDGDAAFDADPALDVRRVGSAGIDRRAAGLMLNAASLREARRFRPDVILSGHVIASLGAIALRRTLRIPLVQYVHADEFRGRAAISAAAVRAADLTIAVSEYTRDMVLETGVAADRVRVIHPGVDLPPTFTVERPSDPPTLLTVARLLFRYKGHDVMTRAMPLIRARVPGTRWVVVGDGPFTPALEHAVAAYGLQDAVDILGRVDDDVREDWLDRADVFAMPSRVPAEGIGGEGFGIVYLEAAAHALPSIGGNAAGALDSVVHDRTGLLVDAADHLAVADAAVALLSDRERARRMGAAARDWAEEHEWPRIAARVEAAIREVAAKR